MDTVKQSIEPADDRQITLEKCLEALFEKDRMSYLGSFVHGLIHNINGPLQNMSMLVEVLIKGQGFLDEFVRAHSHEPLDKWEDLQERQQKRLQQLSQQIAALAEMMRDFMLLHEIERNETEVDLNLVLTKLANAFRADLFFKHQVNVELQLTKNLPLVRVLGRHLIPALVHIFRNALMAMKGTPEKRLTIQSRLENGKIMIVVRDSGCGIENAESEDSCFELFYSDWPAAASRDEREEKSLGFGLFAVRHLLNPYGVAVRLERTGCETEVILDIPLPA